MPLALQQNSIVQHSLKIMLSTGMILTGVNGVYETNLLAFVIEILVKNEIMSILAQLYS